MRRAGREKRRLTASWQAKMLPAWRREREVKCGFRKGWQGRSRSRGEGRIKRGKRLPDAG